MRRLTITGLCAIALLSSCASSGVGSGPATKVTLQCPGKDVDAGSHPVPKAIKDQTIHFDFGTGTCKFTDFHWVGFDGDPPGFTHKHINFPTPTIEYSYAGTAIPEPGYTFTYINDSKLDGNGSGIIKNITN